jgi:hypothetical protein
MNLFLLVLEQLLQLVIVFVDGVSEIGEVIRQHIRIGKAQDHCANGL